MAGWTAGHSPFQGRDSASGITAGSRSRGDYVTGHCSCLTLTQRRARIAQRRDSGDVGTFRDHRVKSCYTAADC
jgi:hypothetical protein